MSKDFRCPLHNQLVFDLSKGCPTCLYEWAVFGRKVTGVLREVLKGITSKRKE